MSEKTKPIAFGKIRKLKKSDSFRVTLVVDNGQLFQTERKVVKEGIDECNVAARRLGWEVSGYEKK